MAVRSFVLKARPLRSLFLHSLHRPNSCSLHHFLSTFAPQNVNSPSSDLVNEICRILSDHRSPHHDLDLSLTNYSSKISTNLVEQVLKRCKNLGFPAHRFFLWAKRVPGFDHSTESYHILVDVLGASKQFAILWDFLIEMRELQHFQIIPEIFWLVFRAYCRADLPNDAIRAFDKMPEFGLKPSLDDIDRLVYDLCKRKHAKHAQKFFDRIKVEYAPTAKTYSILVRGWGDVGEPGQASKVFDEMLERSCVADVLAWNSLLEAICKGGKVDEAYKMFREMVSRGIEPDVCSYSVFIRAHCEANDVYSAFRVLDRMKRYDLVPNVFTYNCLIKKLCKNEKVGEAYILLDEMIERRVSPDTWSYNAILAYHCEHSEVNRATKLVSRMVKDGCLPGRHSYNMLLKLLLRVGRFDRATEVWESMDEAGFYPSVSTYSVMVHGLCKKKGKLEEACKYLEMMVDQGIPPYSTTLDMLRKQLIGRGLLDTIEILAGKMERSTSCSIKDLANELRGNVRSYDRSKREYREETEFESD